MPSRPGRRDLRDTCVTWFGRGRLWRVTLLLGLLRNYRGVMGALKPWHLLVILSFALIIASVMGLLVIVIRLAVRRPPSAHSGDNHHAGTE